ncbi:ABC transporter ATP-binding protein [Limoniibacter endophyticus]|uniref:ABC transporter ATP-binding protein n=1 Tax=Limoniibacter endophyticus TaxID=1565040 RepID=A0A8J3DIQ2_9HYPH|nr:ABC transporter ATP-binding protein [Limoniibacter endophyticus]GHC71119.1 ABC transporter ATP-binding protein [Limoniibacter endophyticus]
MTDTTMALTEEYLRGPAAGGIGLIELFKARKTKVAATAKLEAAEPIAEGKPLIELRNVSKTFGSVKALNDLEVAIQPGELVTVVGPSGCGKSTLFNILAGLEEPDPGNILRLKGKSSIASDLLGQVSFMPQRDLLLPWRNVIDNAILALEIEGMSRSEARKQAMSMLPEFGLAGFEKQHPNQLSGGMRQRVALMRTFLFKRDLMLLDEPFGALDALTRTMMQRWLLDVWQKHKRTVLFITHDVDEAIFLGDRVLVMTARPGKVKLEQVVDLPRPRKPDIVTSPEFIALKKTLLDAIEEESMKSFQVAGH